MYWEASWSDYIQTWYGCFILVYIAIIAIVTIVVITIVNIRNRQTNPLLPDTDRPTALWTMNSGMDWKKKLAMLVVIVLLSSGIYLMVIDEII